jgi:hypothetical protein
MVSTLTNFVQLGLVNQWTEEFKDNTINELSKENKSDSTNLDCDSQQSLDDFLQNLNETDPRP